MPRIDIQREAAARSLAVGTGAYRWLFPNNLAGPSIAKMRARIVKTFLNIEHFKAGAVRIEVRDV